MKEIIATIPVRDRGVITIPSELRNELGIKIGDSISLILKDGEILIRKPKTTYEKFK